MLVFRNPQEPTGASWCLKDPLRCSLHWVFLTWDLGMHMYKRGLQVCAYHFLNFHLVSTSCGCWSSEKLHSQWLFDFMFWGPYGCFRFKTLPWSCLPHTGNSFLKNLLIYPVNASKKTHSHLYFPYWNSNSQMIRLALERLKSVNMSEQTLVIPHCLLLQFHSVC